MRELVAKDVPRHGAHLFLGAAAYQDGAAIEADLVRQDEIVAVSAFRQRDAVIKAQQFRGVIHADPP